MGSFLIAHMKVRYSPNHYLLLVLLKALLPVCMKYTARDEGRVANIALGEAECYISSAIFVTRLSSRAEYFIQTKWQCFKCFIVFYTYLSVNK